MTGAAGGLSLWDHSAIQPGDKTMSATLIINALVVNEGRTLEADVRIRDGRIAQIGQGLTCYGDEELIDAACCCLLPGLIDVCSAEGSAPDLVADLVAGGVTSCPLLTRATTGAILNHGAVEQQQGSDAVTRLPGSLEAVLDGQDSLEALVTRAAHAPALRYRIRERGFLREDCWADLVLVDLHQPGEARDGVRYRASVRTVWVNGAKVWDDQRLLDVRPGRWLEFVD